MNDLDQIIQNLCDDTGVPRNGFMRAVIERAYLAGLAAATSNQPDETDSRELEEITTFDPTKAPRCPVCRTYGHYHRKDCRYAGLGMQYHIAAPPAKAEGNV